MHAEQCWSQKMITKIHSFTALHRLCFDHRICVCMYVSWGFTLCFYIKYTIVFPNVLTITIMCVCWCLLPHVLTWSFWPVLLAVERCDRVRTQSSQAVLRLCCRRAKYMSLSKSRTASHCYFLLIYCSTFSQTSKQPNCIIPSKPIQTSEYLTQPRDFLYHYKIMERRDCIVMYHCTTVAHAFK